MGVKKILGKTEMEILRNKKIKSILGWIISIFGIIVYTVYLSALADISGEAFVYGVTVSCGAIMLGIGKGIKNSN